MATVIPQGEAIRNAVKWISGKRMEDDGLNIKILIQNAAVKYNLSPRDEDFLLLFYEEEKKKSPDAGS